MNLIVCVAYVPDTASRIAIGGDGKSIVEQDVKFVLSPYDEYALQEAVDIKAAKGGKVVAISVGPPRVQQGLRDALARGADEAIAIETDGEPADAAATAELLAAAIRTLPHDLVFFGKMGVGSDSGQLFALVASKLDLPHVSVVVKLEVGDGTLRAEREIEGGREIVESSLPCVLAAQKGLNKPKLPAVKDIMGSKKKPLAVKKPADLGVDLAAAARTTVLKLELPPPRPAAKILSGEPAETARELARLLREEAKVI
jgi:electron transfer flavoprotein beta subunit